jgi:hypothetical protein
MTLVIVPFLSLFVDKRMIKTLLVGKNQVNVHFYLKHTGQYHE